MCSDGKEDFDDLYKILECGEQSSAETLKKSYQRLALKFHPDKQVASEICKDKHSATAANSDEKFVKLNKAWSILSDPGLRARYDRSRKHRKLLQELPIQDIVDFSEFRRASCEVSSLPFFSYDCRCGGEYFIHEDDVKVGDTLARCNTCSLCVEVVYDNDVDSIIDTII